MTNAQPVQYGEETSSRTKTIPKGHGKTGPDTVRKNRHTHTCFRAYHRSCLLWPPTIVHFAGATYLPFSSSRGHLPVVGVYRVSLNLDAFSGVLLLSSSGRWSFVSRALGRGSRERPACIHTRLSFEPGWPRPIARTSK